MVLLLLLLFFILVFKVGGNLMWSILNMFVIIVFNVRQVLGCVWLLMNSNISDFVDKK